MIPVTNKGTVVFKKFMVFLGVLGALFYPILFAPYLNPEDYRALQREGRQKIKQKDIQPGNMNIWSNPFASNSKEAKSTEENNA